MKVTVDYNYGADADGNRGVKQEFYELEHTEQEKQEIAEILYEDFISDGFSGSREIEYEGIEIEVDMEDYHDNLIEMVKKDLDLNYDDVKYIAEELGDKSILIDWLRNKLRRDLKGFGIMVTGTSVGIEVSANVPILDHLTKVLGYVASPITEYNLSVNCANYNYILKVVKK